MECRRVGVSWTRTRARNLNFEDPDVRTTFRNEGLELVKIDLRRPLADQGYFHAIIHKVVDVFFDSVEERAAAIEHAQNYLKGNPGCLLLNPMTNTEVLHDRRRLFPFIRKGLQHEKDFYIPAFVEVNTTDVNEISAALTRENITFPIVCKPVIGTEHLMTVVFSEAGLGDVPSPCVAQAFVQHCGTLYKTYMMGDSQWQFIRNSLADLQPGDLPTVKFDSLNVCEPNRQHILHSEALRPLPNEDAPRLREVSKRLRRVVGMDLIGIDFIYDVATGKYAVIDINDFPGFKGVTDFHRTLARYIMDRLDTAKHSRVLDNSIRTQEGVVADSSNETTRIIR